MRKYSLALAFATLILFLGCGGMGIKGSYEIDRDELEAKIDNEEEFILLDVREPDEFDEGEITYAFNLPRGKLESSIESSNYWDEQAWDVPEKDAEIIIYCRRGVEGALATETLIRMGYTNVRNLYGGYTKWLDPDADVEALEPSGGGCGG